MNGIVNQRQRQELKSFLKNHVVSRESPLLFVPSSNPLSKEEICKRYDCLNIKTDDQNDYPFEMEGDNVNCYDKHLALILVEAGYVAKIPNQRRKLELERFFTDHVVNTPVLFVPTSNPLTEDEIIRRYRLKTNDGQVENLFEMIGDDVNCRSNFIASILIKAGYVPKVLQ